MNGGAQEPLVAAVLHQVVELTHALEDRRLGLLAEFPKTELLSVNALIELLTDVGVEDSDEGLSDGIVWLGENQAIVYANRTAISLLGYRNPGEIVQESARKLLGPVLHLDTNEPQELTPPRPDGLEFTRDVMVSVGDDSPTAFGHPRHHLTESSRKGATGVPGSRTRTGAIQVGLSRLHEPRNPNSHEWRNRNDRRIAGDGAHRGTEGAHTRRMRSSRL